MKESKNRIYAKDQTPRAVECALESEVYDLFSDCLEHEPSMVFCTFINSTDLYLAAKNITSLPESFLRQAGYLERAQEMNTAVHHILSKKLHEVLRRKLGLPANQISLLQPARWGELNLLIYLNS